MDRRRWRRTYRGLAGGGDILYSRARARRAAIAKTARIASGILFPVINISTIPPLSYAPPLYGPAQPLLHTCTPPSPHVALGAWRPSARTLASDGVFLARSACSLLYLNRDSWLGQDGVVFWRTGPGWIRFGSASCPFLPVHVAPCL